eukprot:scaffold7340_cov266-Pinguiococcus_pyrenoidosus.AAC.62
MKDAVGLSSSAGATIDERRALSAVPRPASPSLPETSDARAAVGLLRTLIRRGVEPRGAGAILSELAMVAST